MNKKEIISIDQGFLKNVSEVLEKARKNAKQQSTSPWSMPIMKLAE